MTGTVNEVSAWKITLRSKLKAASQEERPLKESIQKPSWNHKLINSQWVIKLEQFTEDEFNTVLKTFKRKKKAAGIDQIPPEIWKTRKFDDMLLRSCNITKTQ